MSDASITVRPVVAADIEAAIALDRQLTGRSRRGFFEKRHARLATNAGRFAWLVAERGGALAGFVSAHLQEGEFGGTARAAVIDAIATDPAQRGSGIGRALMAALEADLRAQGVTEIRSEADWSDREMVRFFAASGFALAPHLVLHRPVAN
ncbi:GNAT family N-acetyltransferase [Rhodovulum euryhalinum]|uniref:L-amino acid N-acyltransferase YncA n=1 Tax=Rhodovulum euryhalinum TaxID=35805 RepID=A0A4V2SA30_9RHOB|nr:GNAT family N-acetyltransferase [Rhodovulum euryhalinum]TCO70140.1 L-amino acid N-acyltransferase YncA [Rhodovulum euryhalinum]